MEIRPLEPFLAAYLTSSSVNATLEEVSNVLTPIYIHSSLCRNVVVLLLADHLRYKKVIILNGLIGSLAFICLTSSPTMFRLKFAEFGISQLPYMDVLYSGYLYTKIRNKKHYQIATGYVRAGILSGMCLSGIIGQLVVIFSSNSDDYSKLPYFSFAGTSLATVCACFLPAVKHSTFHHVDDTKTDVFSKAVIHNPNTPKYSTEKKEPQNTEQTTEETHLFKHTYDSFKYSYSDRMVLRWCYWHVIGMSGNLHVILYINILYKYVMNASDDKHVPLNGMVYSLASISAAFCAYNIGKLDVDWIRYGDAFLAIGSLAIGPLLLMCYYLKNILLIYAVHIVYLSMIQSIFVIVVSQIAKSLRDNCFALVLGFNAFLSIALSTVMSTIFVLIGISVPEQFLVYGGTFVVLGICYGCAALFKSKMISPSAPASKSTGPNE